jgi:hypothetical protein
MDKKDQATLTGVSQATNSTTYQRPKRDINMVRTTLIVGMLVIAVVLSACSSSAGTNSPTSTPPSVSVPQHNAAPPPVNTLLPTSVPQNTATPTQALIPTATSVPQQATVNTALDPCNLINSQEASTLTGTSFGNGKEGTTPEGMRMCTYASQTKSVFTVDVIQAPDEATAQAYKAQFLADLQAQLQQLTNEGLNVTELPNFADGAVFADASVNVGAITMNGSAFGVLKGTIFFGFSDIDESGAATPNSAAMQSEATTVLGKLP